MTDVTEASLLLPAALPAVSAAVVVPSYDRSAVRRSIVHLGVGGFHRAHLATYIDELCERGNTNWGILGYGILPGDSAMADALEPQDGLFTLITRGADATEVQVIASILDYHHAWPAADKLIEAIAAPDTQIVSLTITEAGYPVDDVTGHYRSTSPNAGPTSAFGIIAAGLDQRRRAGGPPITIMSCDNIMSNGHVAEAATLGEAGRFGADLITWIAQAVSFPNSMVDRITPATADTDRTWLAEAHGIVDNWPVVTEPFRQWVVEDNFAGDRLPLEQLDILVTDDVEPYEFMKLRLLNAGHSCLAYLAALDGMETVDQAMADPAIANYVRTLLHLESKPVLPEVAGIDVDSYIEMLIERFSNPAIGDQISRLCLDGTAKFPKFLLPTVRAQIAAAGPLGLSALALAGWCQYLLGTDDHGVSIERSPDPQLAIAIEYAQRSLSEPTAFLEFEAVFGEDVRRSAGFRAAFAHALAVLRAGPVRSAIGQALREAENPGGEPTS